MSNSFKPILVIGSAIVFMTIVSLYLHSNEKDIIPWRDDYQGAKVYAAQSNKLMMLDFTASWCPPCNEMKRTTWANQAVKDSLVNFVPVRVDVDENKALASQFNIVTIPHLFIIDTNGHILREMNGAMTPEQFVEWIKQK